MSKKLTTIVIILLFNTIFLISCKPADTESIEYTLNQFTSTEYAGRLYGTDGNKKAIQHISDILQQNGCLSLTKKSFAIPFYAELPIITSTSLIISGDTDILLKEGEHYVYNVITPETLSGTIPENAKDLVSDSSHRQIEVNTNNKSLILFETYMRTGGDPLFHDNESTTINLTKSGMDIVLENSGKQIEFSCNGSVENMELENVFGVLPGKDASRAIIVGAHFDHMGKIGSTIYQGAVDNASGVSTLLDVVRKMSGKAPDVDIVFAFWNAEEFGMQGSKSSAAMFDEIYGDYCYINLDCVGMKDAGSTLITTINYSEAMCSTLSKLLNENGYENAVYSEEYMPSDHTSFSECGAINLGQSMDTIMDTIHTPDDTIKAININELEQLALALSRTLEQSSLELLDSSKVFDVNIEEDGSIILPEGDYSTMSDEEQLGYIKEIEAQLAFDEYFLLPNRSSDMYIVSQAGEYFNSINKVNELYSKMEIASSVDNYELVQIHIVSDTIPVENEVEKSGKIIKRQFDTSLITSVELFYKNDNKQIVYSEYFNKDNDVNSYVNIYDSYIEVPDIENAWLILTDEDKIPAELFVQNGNKIISISQGPISIDNYGIYNYFLPDDSTTYTADTLKSIYKDVLNNPPLNINLQ